MVRLAATGLLLALGLTLAAGCSRSVQVLAPDRDAGDVDGGRREDAGGAPLDAGPAPSGVSDIASGSGHVCRLDEGELLCWGTNGSGQLGDGTRVAQLTPIRIGTRADWVQVGTGEGFSCGRTTACELLCWGENSNGQLGQGDVVDRLDATVVPGGPWATFTAGQAHVCAIDEAGTLRCWGHNFEGQIGLADPFGSGDVLAPTEVTPGTRYLDVSAGDGHTCAIREDGRMLCWGRNSDAQLGIGAGAPIQVREPTLVGTDTFSRVSVSQHHSCGLRDDGALFCWGEDGHGELGQGLAVGSGTRFDDPAQVGVRVDWVDLDLHWFNTCAIDQGGGLWCAGRGIEGQLGQGNNAASGVLVRVMHPERFARVALGRFHACAQDGPRGAVCWGANGEGQLGTGDTDRRTLPTPTAR